jgi:hypothetical protein
MLRILGSRKLACDGLQATAGDDAARVFYHDAAGWFMMALALGLMWLELRLLSWLLVEPEAAGPEG